LTLDTAFCPDRGHFIGIVGRFDDRRLARHLKRAFRGATTVPAYIAAFPWLTRIAGIP
jgi:hypothetical protein